MKCILHWDMLTTTLLMKVPDTKMMQICWERENMRIINKLVEKEEEDIKDQGKIITTRLGKIMVRTINTSSNSSIKTNITTNTNKTTTNNRLFNSNIITIFTNTTSLMPNNNNNSIKTLIKISISSNNHQTQSWLNLNKIAICL